MKKLLMLCAVLLSTSAMAVGIGNDNPPSTGGDNTQTTIVTPITDVNARARAEAWAASQSLSQASNKTSVVSSPTQASDNRSTASVGASTVNLSTGGVSVNTAYPEKQTIRNVPNVSLAAMYPSANCHGTTTVGGSGVGFGIGFGTSWEDSECQIRETARSFSGLGLKDDAVSVLCTSKYAAAAPSCPKPAVQPVQE
jgi:hypothetical protein